MTMNTTRKVFTSRLKSMAEKFIKIYHLNAMVSSVTA
jgi:hypothetical protein